MLAARSKACRRLVWRRRFEYLGVVAKPQRASASGGGMDVCVPVEKIPHDPFPTRTLAPGKFTVHHQRRTRSALPR